MRNLAYVHIRPVFEVLLHRTTKISVALEAGGIRTSENALGGLAAQWLHVW